LRVPALRAEVDRLRVPVLRAIFVRLRVPVLRPVVVRLRVPVLRPVVDRLRVPVLPDVLRLRVPVERVRPVVDRFRVPVLLFFRELVPERLRLAVVERELPDFDADFRDPDLREPELRDVERDRPDVEPDRVPLVRRRPRDDAERARLVPTLCRLRDRLLDPLSSSSESDDSSSSPSSPSSFFATPTAAGTATPRAAPATTFCVVDMPSSSLSPLSS
jgi:hypothetical protein